MSILCWVSKKVKDTSIVKVWRWDDCERQSLTVYKCPTWYKYMVINIVNGLRRWIHVPLAALACLTRGRGDDRVVCLARNSPIATTLYIHTPLALFRVTHSCGNVSIVTSWALYGQQLGAGIWAEACADTSLCVLVSGSSALESAHLELQALTLIWSKLNDRRGEEQVDRKEGEKHRTVKWKIHYYKSIILLFPHSYFFFFGRMCLL